MFKWKNEGNNLCYISYLEHPFTLIQTQLITNNFWDALLNLPEGTGYVVSTHLNHLV